MRNFGLVKRRATKADYARLKKAWKQLGIFGKTFAIVLLLLPIFSLSKIPFSNPQKAVAALPVPTKTVPNKVIVSKTPTPTATPTTAPFVARTISPAVNNSSIVQNNSGTKPTPTSAPKQNNNSNNNSSNSNGSNNNSNNNNPQPTAVPTAIPTVIVATPVPTDVVPSPTIVEPTSVPTTPTSAPEPTEEPKEEGESPDDLTGFVEETVRSLNLIP